MILVILQQSEITGVSCTEDNNFHDSILNRRYSLSMTSEETREKKITRTMEKVIMSFMYLLFGFMFLGVAFSRELSGLFVVVPRCLQHGLTNGFKMAE